MKRKTVKNLFCFPTQYAFDKDVEQSQLKSTTIAFKHYSTIWGMSQNEASPKSISFQLESNHFSVAFPGHIILRHNYLSLYIYIYVCKNIYICIYI